MLLRRLGGAVVVDPGPRHDPGPQTESLRWRWTAPWLDTAWELTDLTSPVLKLKGATGTGQADPEHWWSEAAALDGSVWEGSRVGRGEVFLPLLVRGTDSFDFLAEADAFKRSLDRRREGVLRITRPDGQWREIACRYVSGADFAIDVDPVKSCSAKYGITWATADPFWSGEPVVARFGYELPPPFFPLPPLVLGSGRSLSNAKVVNPGDEDTAAIWKVGGPYTGFTVGVGDSLVSATISKTAGQWVNVDMRPGVKTITDEKGVDVWDAGAVTAVDFSALPPGETQAVTTLNGAGPGSYVELSFTPRYRSGW